MPKKKGQENQENINNEVPVTEAQSAEGDINQTEEKKPRKGRPNKVSRRLNDELFAESMFWYYVSLGEKRSLEKVAEHFNIDLWVVKEASRNFKWSERLASLGDTDDVTASEIIKYADAIQISVLNQIINNPDTKPADKLKALQMLNEFTKRSSELIRKKKIVIEFPNREALEKVVAGLKDGSIYKDLGLGAGLASALPDDYQPEQ